MDPAAARSVALRPQSSQLQPERDDPSSTKWSNASQQHAAAPVARRCSTRGTWRPARQPQCRSPPPTCRTACTRTLCPGTTLSCSRPATATAAAARGAGGEPLACRAAPRGRGRGARSILEQALPTGLQAWDGLGNAVGCDGGEICGSADHTSLMEEWPCLVRPLDSTKGTQLREASAMQASRWQLAAAQILRCSHDRWNKERKRRILCRFVSALGFLNVLNL